MLDGDKGERLESSSGRVASRDIVQFVALRDMQCESCFVWLKKNIERFWLGDDLLCVWFMCRWRGLSGRSVTSGIAFTVFNVHEKR